MNEAGFNSRLCNERHERIDKRLELLENSVERMKFWLVSTLTALCLNLIGVLALLIKSF